jgi:hypothetical protein
LIPLVRPSMYGVPTSPQVWCDRAQEIRRTAETRPEEGERATILDLRPACEHAEAAVLKGPRHHL